MNEEFVVLFVSVENIENALQISRVLVSEKLCACSTIIQNTTSIYEWEGKIDERGENLIVIKTTKEKLDNLIPRINELHPDQIPEIIALPIINGLPEYLQWVKTVTHI